MDTQPQNKAATYDQNLDRLINEHEAAAFLGYTVRDLQNWRVRGGGPRFVKISSRSVRYRHRDLLEWTQHRLRSSTSDLGAPADARRTG